MLQLTPASGPSSCRWLHSSKHSLTFSSWTKFDPDIEKWGCKIHLCSKYSTNRFLPCFLFCPYCNESSHDLKILTLPRFSRPPWQCQDFESSPCSSPALNHKDLPSSQNWHESQIPRHFAVNEIFCARFAVEVNQRELPANFDLSRWQQLILILASCMQSLNRFSHKSLTRKNLLLSSRISVHSKSYVFPLCVKAGIWPQCVKTIVVDDSRFELVQFWSNCAFVFLDCRPLPFHNCQLGWI